MARRSPRRLNLPIPPKYADLYGVFDVLLRSLAEIDRDLDSTIELDTARITTGTFADARIAASNVTQHVAAIDHDALLNFDALEHIRWDLTGLEDIHADRISQASVTQHQAALSLAGSQITSGTVADARLSANVPLLNAVSNAFTGDLILSGDNEQLRFGIGNDLQLYSDGTSGHIDSSAHLWVEVTGTNSFIVSNESFRMFQIAPTNVRPVRIYKSTVNEQTLLSWYDSDLITLAADIGPVNTSDLLISNYKNSGTTTIRGRNSVGATINNLLLDPNALTVTCGDGSNLIVGGGLIYLLESAAAGADTAGRGQLWIRSSDSALMYTSDSGVDRVVQTA